MNYEQYMESEEWKALRAQAYDRAGGQCELCGGKAAAAHHIKYPKDYREDAPQNLLVVCELCHRKLHGIRGELAEAAYYSQLLKAWDIEERCPHCMNEAAHPIRVAININGNISIIESDGLRLMSGKPTGQGASIWVHFACEEDHRWAVRWQFNKGKTYKTVDSKPGIDIEPYGWTTLWRGGEI